MSDSTQQGWHDEPYDEILDGVTVPMSPHPDVNHSFVRSHIRNLFYDFMKDRTDYEEFGGVGVFLTEKDCFIPDFLITKTEYIRQDGVHGVPELVAEVLYPATAGRDRGYKMRVYEQYGVPELWFVTPGEKTLEQYFWRDGRYFLHEVYALSPEWESDWKPEIHRWVKREKQDVVFHCRLFPELDISLNEIFRDLLEKTGEGGPHGRKSCP